MKILKIAGILCASLFASTASIAQDMQEVVHLKNGSIIRGTIIEQVPNESLKVKTSDGNVFVYKMDEVARTTKEEAYASSNKSSYPKRGYRGFGEFGMHVSAGDWAYNSYHRVSLSTAHGFQFNPHFFIGGGFAVQSYFAKDEEYDENEYIAVPVFVDARFDFIKKKVSPFVDVRIGYTSGDVQGGYFAPSAGIRLSHFNFSIGYELQQAEVSDGNYYSSLVETNVNAVMFKISWDWGSR